MVKIEQRTKIWNSKGECFEGIIGISKSGMSIVRGSGYIPNRRESVLYEIRNNLLNFGNNNFVATPLDVPIKIKLDSLYIVDRLYAKDVGQAPENIFPESTGGFYGRMITGSELATFIVQEIENDSRFWLTIISSDESVIYEAHMINPYELGVLGMVDDVEFDNHRFNTITRKIGNRLWNELVKALDEPSPTWDEVSLLKEDVIVPNLSIEKTARETMSRLVPESFPEDIREQIMVFLTHTTKKTVPSIDPVDYFSELLSFPLLRGLFIVHTQCMLDKVKQPPYVKLMTLAARKQLHSPKRIQQEIMEDQSWMAFWNRVVEIAPDWKYIAIQYARKLNKSGRITLKLPVSKSAASRSKRLWRDRLGMLSAGLLIRAIVEPQSLGLRQIVYIGAAYRWPHRHMSWISRLGSVSEHPPHMQIMMMPPSAAERVKRFLPSVIEIGWSSRTVNLDLFDDNERKWSVSVSKIVDSVSEDSTKNRLIKKFGGWSRDKVHLPTKEEMEVADIAAKGIYLADTEIPYIYELEGLSVSKINSTLTRLCRRGVLKTGYEIIDDTLIAILTIAQGPPNRIYSLVESFLKNTPTSLTMVSDASDQCIILSRFPEEDVYNLVKSLVAAGRENGLTIRCIRPGSIKSYTHNLYQRLLREDGTWDDDVSAFLSQARSKRRELSESNA